MTADRLEINQANGVRLNAAPKFHEPAITARSCTRPAIFLIILLSLAGYGYLLQPGLAPYSEDSDFVAQHLTTKTFLYDSVHQGRGVPFWRNDMFSGYAGLSNPQAMYAYPLHFLFYIFRPEAALGATYYLHFLLAGLAFYALGAVLGLGFWPSLFLAAAGMFNFKLLIATHAGWLPVVPIIALLPALMASVFWAVKRPTLPRALVLAVVGAFCLHCGQPQLLYYMAWFLLVYVLIAFLKLGRRRKWRQLSITTGWFTLGIVLAVGLSCYLLLPMLAEVKLSSRADVSYSFFLSDRKFGVEQLLTFLYPKVQGAHLNINAEKTAVWEEVGYFGLLPLLLAAIGVWLGRRRPFTIFLGACFLMSVLLAFDTFILRFVYNVVPGFKLFRLPGRFFFLASIFGICLAGIGLEELLGRLKNWKPQFGRLPAFVAVALIAFVTAEGIFHARSYLQMAPYEKMTPHTDYKEFFAEDASLYRVTQIDRPVNSGWAAGLGLQMVTGYDSLIYRDYVRYVDLMQWGYCRPVTPFVRVDQNKLDRPDMMDVLNVKYLISTRSDLVLPNLFELAARFPNQPIFTPLMGYSSGDIYIYRNLGCAERAYFAGQLLNADDESTVNNLMQTRNLHDYTIVQAGRHEMAATQESPEDRLEIAEFAPGFLKVKTHNIHERFLVVAEVWHPGWHVSIDGMKAHKYQVNMTMMGLYVPPGDHEVTVEFRPMFWPQAAVISLVAGAVFVIGIVMAGMGKLLSKGRVSTPVAGEISTE